MFSYRGDSRPEQVPKRREMIKAKRFAAHHLVQPVLAQNPALSEQVLMTPVSGFCLLPGDVFVAWLFLLFPLLVHFWCQSPFSSSLALERFRRSLSVVVSFLLPREGGGGRQCCSGDREGERRQDGEKCERCTLS